MDKKKTLKIVGMEIVSILAFLLMMGILFAILIKVTPSTQPDPNILYTLTLEQVEQQRNELVTFVWTYLVLLTVLISGALFIFNYSRKIIWNFINTDKFNFKVDKPFFKYAGLNTLLTIIAYVIVGLFIFLWQKMTESLAYNFNIAEPIKLVVLQMIPMLFIYYMLNLKIFILNYHYQKTPTYKVYKKLLDVNWKNYAKPVIIIAVIFYALNYVAYLKPNSIIFYVLGVGAYATQSALLKLVVYDCENYKKTKKSKKK